MKPQMQQKEIATIEKILLSYGAHIDVLEWGSGGSTVYFTKFLRDQGISYVWTSIEYNKNWYERIFDKVKGDQDVRLKLFDVGNTELKQRLVPMDEYVSYPSTLGKKYDLILVDGRKRRRCLLEASRLLKPGGTVLLHDARRTYYHCAFSAFPERRILLWSGLWQGKMDPPNFLQRIINSIMYWCFRVYTLSFRLKALGTKVG
jgi:SAM-dependent methyltransferase